MNCLRLLMKTIPSNLRVSEFGLFFHESHKKVILHFKRTFHVSSSNSLNLVPIVVEQTGRGERAFDIFSRLLKERIM